MAERTPASTEPLGGGDGPALSWEVARERLENPETPRTNWLATVSSEGQPHVTLLIGIWLDGCFYYLSGERTRKGQNLAANPFGPNAPTAGPPPYAFFELIPTTVTGLPGLAATEGGTAGSLAPTRWRF